MTKNTVYAYYNIFLYQFLSILFVIALLFVYWGRGGRRGGEGLWETLRLLIAIYLKS
jgi:hypothetical protein